MNAYGPQKFGEIFWWWYALREVLVVDEETLDPLRKNGI
jgi:hypothetical protein